MAFPEWIWPHKLRFPRYSANDEQSSVLSFQSINNSECCQLENFQCQKQRTEKIINESECHRKAFWKYSYLKIMNFYWRNISSLIYLTSNAQDPETERWNAFINIWVTNSTRNLPWWNTNDLSPNNQSSSFISMARALGRSGESANFWVKDSHTILHGVSRSTIRVGNCCSCQALKIVRWTSSWLEGRSPSRYLSRNTASNNVWT